MMWLEARKQEKKIRGMLVDYKRRAERRKDYYEKIKADPTQFIQVHGRPCKIHLDPAVAIAGDSPANMMSWQGNSDIMIDRFDVRAHLDVIPEVKHLQDEDEEPSQDERMVNYERYRILAQNDFLGVSEDKFLHQLMIEEQFGPVEKLEPQPIEGKKKVVGAAIGFNYGEGTSVAAGSGEPDKQISDDDSQDEDDDDDDSDIDFDLCVDVNKVTSAQAHELNGAAHSYGMLSNDFFSFLTRDVEEAENIKIAREREEEKAMFSGRKSRRERRAFREKRLHDRKLSPPSYAASKEDPIADLIRIPTKSKSRSRTRSPSPPNAGMIQYITSFGGEEPPVEPPPPPPVTASVHRSKEDSNSHKRTVRYKSSRSPESRARRSNSAESRDRHRSYGRGSSNGRRSRSPSPVRKVRYRSRSRSPVRSSYRNVRRRRSKSNSRSDSPSIRIVRKRSSTPQPVRSVEVPAPPVITRYYGRHKNESSSSDLDLSESEDQDSTSTIKTTPLNKRSDAVGNAGGRSKPGLSSSKVSVQELLKKKRQALINRQYKADKKAERLRQEKAEQERQDREEEMRELSIKMRRRERQKRHQYYELDSNPGDSDEEGRLSNVSSDNASGSDSEHRSKTKGSRRSRDRDSERSKKSSERERSRGRESRRESEDGRRDSDSRSSRRGRDDRDRDRSRDRDKSRDRQRDKERSRRERDSRRDRSRDRPSGHSRDRDYHSPGVQAKRPFRPLVDY